MPSITVQPGAAGNDCELRQNSATTNVNGNPLTFNQTSSSSARNLPISFDISAIPAGSTIDLATLTYNVTTVIGNVIGFKITQLTQAFLEASATWNTYNGSDVWPGGGGGLGDVDDTFAVTGSTPGDTGAWAHIVTGIAQDAIDAESGIARFLLHPTTEVGAALIFITSSEDSTEAIRPKLVVDYTLAGFSKLEKGSGYFGASHARIVEPSIS